MDIQTVINTYQVVDKGLKSEVRLTSAGIPRGSKRRGGRKMMSTTSLKTKQNLMQTLDKRKMPSSRQGTHPTRKVHYSCDFCRSRKLRCDRPLPCANCVSRGKDCRFGPAIRQSARSRQLQQQEETPPQPSASTQAGLDQAGLLAEIRSLKQLAQDLEKRVIQTTSSQQAQAVGNPSPPTSASSGDGYLDDSSPQSHLSDVLAHLELVSLGPTQDPVCFEETLVRITNIQSITAQDEYTYSPSGQPRRFIWLPQRAEAMIMLDKFIRDVSFFHHVVHRPSLAGIVDNLYDQIERDEPYKSGHLMLVLSIIANAAKAWLPRDDLTASGSPFSSAAAANSQTRMWVKTALEVLHSGRSSITPSIEGIQGIILLSLLICSLEGLSLRYRSLLSTGIILSRELGLHRLDHPSSPTRLPPIQAEMGRRAWWQLAASNWLMAARSSLLTEGIYDIHPHHIATSRPLNINDADLSDTIPFTGHPPSEPTEMSYFLQRIHLAEISRKAVDARHGPLSRAEIRTSFDQDLEEMLTHAPRFFTWDAYTHGTDASRDDEIFVHAYTFRHIVNVQRIKLHWGYLSRGGAGDRDKCLCAARQVVRGEKEVERSRHPFVEVRLRSSGVLYGVFLAAVVLVVDGVVHGGGEDEAEEALGLVKEARTYSVAAGKVYDGLVGLRGRNDETTQVGMDEATGEQMLGGFGEVDFGGLMWIDFFSGMDSSSIF
ncbi:hypothetical protein OQA88_8729 [Cercophora sp. LCS_1]